MIIISGSPVIAQNLPGQKYNINLDDPQPPEFRNMPDMPDSVTSKILKVCCNTNKDILMRYLYGKAHIKSPVHDHTYTRVFHTSLG